MEDYFFDISEEASHDSYFILIIYDIVSNTKRVKFAKLLQRYGFRIQKSAFEAIISKKKYKQLIEKIPSYVAKEDSIKVYKIIGRGQVTSFGTEQSIVYEDVTVV